MENSSSPTDFAMDKEVEEKRSDLYPKIVYQPKALKENENWRFRKFVENRYALKFNDYWEIYEWSRKNYREFWECVWIFFDIISSETYTEVFDKNGSIENTVWFEGAKLNYAENVLRVRSSKIAIITADKDDTVKHISYEQLYSEVAVYAEAMKDIGIKKGDLVACYMSNKVEAIYAHFAAASIGALWCGTHPLFGVKAVVSTLGQTNPKILFASGNFHLDGKEIDMIKKLRDIIKSLPSLKKVVFVPSSTKKHRIEDLPGCVFIEDFLRPSRDKISEWGVNIIFEQVPFNYPLCVSFTSGTTGAPKGLIHSHGALLGPLKDLALFWGCTTDDVLLNCTQVGWIAWHVHVSMFYLGLTHVLYDGVPFEETPTRFWDIVDKFAITCTFIKSSSAEIMEKKKYIPTEKHNLQSLKGVYPTGSVCKPQTFEFFTNIKPGLFFCPIYGGTETFGMLSGMDSNLPVYKGEIQCFSLGFDLRTVDTRGNYTVGQRGDIVQLNPSPTTPISILGDNSKTKVKEMYLTKYAGTWDTGDDAWINPVTKGFIIYGRSNDIMKPKATRFNCSDISFTLEGFPGISDSLCISKFNSKLDERVILFVKMAPEYSLTPKVEDKIRNTIEYDLSHECVPDLIMEVPDIPYNINGKKLNNLVKKLINKRAVPNAENVLNASSVEFFRNLDLGDF